MNPLDFKFLEQEKFKYYFFLPFKKWYFYYFLDEKERIIRTTFLQSKIDLKMKINNIFSSQFKHYFKTGYLNKNIIFYMDYLPNKYKKIYNFLWEHWDSIFYYGEIATSVGIKNGARFVGYLMKINPLPLIIPCHHVIGKKNPYHFSLGKDLKMELLKIENRNLLNIFGGKNEGNGS